MSSKAKGGITKGKSHAEGGMPMVVKSTGQKVELEGGEGVINKKNMADTQKHEFEGKMLTKCEIASEINSDGGNGVEIDCDGIVGKKYKHQDGGRLAEGGKIPKVDSILVVETPFEAEMIDYDGSIEMMTLGVGNEVKVTDVNSSFWVVNWNGNDYRLEHSDIQFFKSPSYAKGGEIIFTDVFDTKPRSYKSWETRKSKNTDENSFGAFAHRYNDRYKGDYYLYRLSQYDEDFYSHIPLKEGEILARVETDNMIGGEMPLVKININNGRVYFMSDENNPKSDEDDKNPKFNRASADVIYLSLDESTKDYEKFGYDKHSRYKNIRYETDLSSYDIDSLVRRMDNYYDINYEELFGLNKQSVIDFITSYNMGRGMASFELQEFFQIESALNDEFFQSLLKEYKRKQFGDDFAKGGKVSKEYKVFNYTDNIYASNQTFNSVAEANKFIKDFRKRFEVQGYYRDNRRNKISPEHIDLEVIDETFSPYGFAKGGDVKALKNISKALKKGSKIHKKQSEQLEGASISHKAQSKKLDKIANDLSKVNYAEGGEIKELSDKGVIWENVVEFAFGKLNNNIVKNGYQEPKTSSTNRIFSSVAKNLSKKNPFTNPNGATISRDILKKAYYNDIKQTLIRQNKYQEDDVQNFWRNFAVNSDELKEYIGGSTYAEGGNMPMNVKFFDSKGKTKESEKAMLNNDKEETDLPYPSEMVYSLPPNAKYIKTIKGVEIYKDKVTDSYYFKLADGTFAKGGNIDGFDETYKRFEDNIREAFGQPRQNNIVILESDYGFKKSELPQLRTKDKGLFKKMLVSKYGANVVTQDIKVKAKLLKPIQSEINLKQIEVIAKVSQGKMNPNKPITISKDGYIIDGHHRWYYAKQNDLDISVLQINLDANKVIDEIWQSGLAEKEDIDSVRKQNGGKI